LQTWLNNVTEDAYFLPGYDLATKSRSGKIGGRVGIFVSNSVNYSLRYDLCRMSNYITQVNKQNILMGYIYRPPCINKESLDLFISDFTDILGVIDSGKRW